MATKNNRRTLITKRILKESLLELMQTQPIVKITIKDICDLSDMSRSTFYLHYQDQYALLEDLENDVINNTVDYFTSMNTQLSSIEAIEQFLLYVKMNKTTFGILLCQPENKIFQNSIKNTIKDYLQSFLPKEHDPSIEDFFYSFIMNGCLGTITDWIESDFRTTEKDLAALIYEICNNITHFNWETVPVDYLTST